MKKTQLKKLLLKASGITPNIPEVLIKRTHKPTKNATKVDINSALLKHRKELRLRTKKIINEISPIN